MLVKMLDDESWTIDQNGDFAFNALDEQEEEVLTELLTKFSLFFTLSAPLFMMFCPLAFFYVRSRM